MNNNTWPDPAHPGVPLNPERDGWHWLIRKNGQWPEAWRWDPDADGCGTEYSGAWAESEGDGQPEGMAKWYRYLGPCLTPAEVNAIKDSKWYEGYAAGVKDVHRGTAFGQKDAYVSGRVQQARRDALEKAAPGMVLVPREPTDAMIRACLQAAFNFMKETKTTEVHPGQIYPSPIENARRCWRAMVNAAGKGEAND